MKWINKLLIALFLIVMLLGIAPVVTVSAQTTGNGEGKVVVGGTYTLASGETLVGDLVLIGGSAELAEESTVTGSVLIAGGTLDADGMIKGDVLIFGGILNLHENARVNGDLVSYGGINNLDEGARILGNTVNNEGDFANFNWENFDFNFDNFNFNGLDLGNMTPNSQAFSATRVDMLKEIGKFFWTIAKAIGIAILAVGTSLFLAKPLDRTAQTLFKFPALSFGVGLLTIVVLPLLLVVLMITLILIPVSLIGLIGVGVAVLYGWFALSLMLGERLAQLFHTEWAPAISTGIGSLALSLVTAVTGIVPCIGWLFPFFFASAGLGAVVLSRFGSRIYVSEEKTSTTSKPKPASIPSNVEEYTLPEVDINDNTSADESGDVLPPLDLDAVDDDAKGEPGS